MQLIAPAQNRKIGQELAKHVEARSAVSNQNSTHICVAIQPTGTHELCVSDTPVHVQSVLKFMLKAATHERSRNRQANRSGKWEWSNERNEAFISQDTRQLLESPA